jgi:hypothetical protein
MPGGKNLMRYYLAAAVLCVAVALGFLLTGPAVSADNDWATLKGQIVYGEEKIPAPIELPVSKDQDHCLAKGKLFSEEWVINPKNKGVKWVFVWLAPTEAGKEIPIHPDLKEIKEKSVVIDQPCCKFEPHAVGMREGQVLIAKNSAPIIHNFHYVGNPIKGVGGNPAIAPKTEVEIKDLKADEKYPVQVDCTIHGWMKAYIRVYNHPYFAVTDEDGKFEFKNAPAGDYRLKVWLGGTGWRGGQKGRDGDPITIKGGQVNDLGKLEIKP